MKKYDVKVESWISGELVACHSEVMLSDADAIDLLKNGDVVLNAEFAEEEKASIKVKANAEKTAKADAAAKAKKEAQAKAKADAEAKAKKEAQAKAKPNG